LLLARFAVFHIANVNLDQARINRSGKGNVVGKTRTSLHAGIASLRLARVDVVADSTKAPGEKVVGPFVASLATVGLIALPVAVSEEALEASPTLTNIRRIAQLLARAGLVFGNSDTLLSLPKRSGAKNNKSKNDAQINKTDHIGISKSVFLVRPH
jgi:hypothetical protein